MRKISLASVAHLFGCEGDFSVDLIQGFSVDSRKIQPGCIFFALPGQRADGHFFLEEVRQRGAIAAVVSKEYRGVHGHLPLLRVRDPLESLQKLAQVVLNESRSKIVAITGSLGKTTTKEFTKTILGLKYSVGFSEGNQNSHIGLPLTILNDTSGKEEIFVFEMGMTHPGNLAKLVEIVPPDIAVMTKAALVHACNFASVEEIARTKAEIFSHPKTFLGIIPRDLSNFSEISQMGNAKKISFSLMLPEADFYLQLQPLLKLMSKQESKTIVMQKPQFSGRHQIHNMLVACVIARSCGMDWSEINEAIPLLRLPERRSQSVYRKGVLFFNDSYNAAEESLIAALESLPSSHAGGKKIAVIGSMVELGMHSEGCHRRVGKAALDYVEKIYCIGEECYPMVEEWNKRERVIHYFENRNDLLHKLRKDLHPNDVVLVKGSKPHELWKIIEEF